MKGEKLAEDTQLKVEWKRAKDGYERTVTATGDSHKQHFAIVRVAVSFETSMDFEETQGRSVKEQIEQSRMDIARNIAERTS